MTFINLDLMCQNAIFLLDDQALILTFSEVLSHPIAANCMPADQLSIVVVNRATLAKAS